MVSVKRTSFLTKRSTQESAGTDTGLESELYATDGPTGVRVVAEPSDPVVDIVFVHGLTGNREKTWTHRNGVFWPGHLLPDDFPRARIMTFGYDANVVRFWTIASSNRLDDHGKSLAYALLDQRGQVGQRPIVFIAHSLGGLVCEEALNLSSKREDLRSILSNTIGVIFMGTPHGGSQMADWGSIVAKYVNIFRGTNRDILQNLQPGSSDLQRVEEDFQHMLRRPDVKLKVFCFYEALRMNDTVGKIVERESAILPGYDNNSINADHRNMTRFVGRADVGYGHVRGILERWTKTCENSQPPDYIPAGSENSAQPTVPAEPLEPVGSTGTSPTEGISSRNALNHGAVFNGPITGKYVIPGAQVTGGTANFNFPG